MSKDLLGQNAHEQNGVLEIAFRAGASYITESRHRNTSLIQLGVVRSLLDRQPARYVHQEGVEVTLLFIANDTRTGEDVAVYAAQFDDGKATLSTCPLDEFYDEFSKVDNPN